MASDQNARDLSHALYQFTLTGKLDAGVSKDDLENWVKKQSKQSKAIDRQLQQDQGKYKSEIVILLLGTGESGKSTVAKQFRLINHNEYTKEELEDLVRIIHHNVLGAVRRAVKYAEEEELDLSKKKKELDEIMAVEVQQLTPELGEKIAKLFESSTFSKVLNHEGYQQEDSEQYFLSNLARVSAMGYVPTTQDILHARQKTTGIVETQFISQNALFRIVDVGGQRSERKKWSMLFSDITGIIFCADVSCYDTPLREDPRVNRLLDSLQVFAQICANKDLTSRDIILFLNKTDLLAKKVKRSPFPELTQFASAPKDATAATALQFIETLYRNVAKEHSPNKVIYVHHTIATDTANIQQTFTEIVKEIIRKDNVNASF